MLALKWRSAVANERPRSDGATPKVSEIEIAPEIDNRAGSAADRHAALVDPGKAGWESEQFSNAAMEQLNRLQELLNVDDVKREELLRSLFAEDFVGQALHPAVLKEIMNKDPLIVRISDGDQQPERKLSTADFLREFENFAGHKGKQKFKIVGTDIVADHFGTRVRVEMNREEKSGDIKQVTTVWNIVWTRTASQPSMKSLSVDGYEEVELKSAGERLFADCTNSVMAGAPSFNQQFAPDAAYWSKRLGVLESSSFIGHVGIAVGDVNGDLLDDLYVCDAGGLPNRLYIQNNDGTLEDRSAVSGTDWLENSASALLVDLDNDGDQDLVVATVHMLLFMENDGHAKFSLKGAHPGVTRARSLSAADYDNDGDLDIYVCGYDNPNKATGFGARGMVASIPLPYNDANNGAPNMLLANNGGFDFIDQTKISGLDHNNTRFSFSASWEDFDQDGDIDLYVANDFGRNNLYLNEGSGKFRDIAAESGVEDMASGMSVSWGDCNRDGHMDLYVGNMFSAAGKRVAYQPKFKSTRSDESLNGIKRMARGNSLFLGGKGDGGSKFEDVSESAGVTMGRWAWSSKFADLNNDGWLDLLIGNGFVTGPSLDDL
ncbi:MAG: VCBS repeat-containing protein [Verrucomicrobiales bacterium]